MKKKYLWFLLFTVFILVNAYSIPEIKLSAGAGLYTTGDFGGGYEYSRYLDIFLDWDRGTETVYEKTYNKTPYFGGGVYAFFDIVFVEVNLGFFMAGGEWEFYNSQLTGLTYGKSDLKSGVFVTGLDIGLLLKYPFVIKNITVFPLAGINYRSSLNGTEYEEEEKMWVGDRYHVYLNTFWFKFGGGCDIPLTDNIYFRGNVLYGFRLKNRSETYIAGGRNTYNTYTSYPGHGFNVKFAIGFKSR